MTLWDVESRSVRQGPFSVGSSAVAVSFSADGTTLATAGPTGVKLWDVATGAELKGVGDSNPADDVAFSPTEPFVAFVRAQGVAGGDAQIWNMTERSRIAALQVNPSAPNEYRFSDRYAIAFGPDGRMLATAGDEPLVHIWDAKSGKLIREFDQNVGGVATLAFSSDGKTLAISGLDPVTSLWDVASGTQIGPKLPTGSRKTMLDQSPDGRHLLTTAANGQGVVWDINPESWKQRACDLANRTLTREEWDEFLPGRPYKPACTP
jgi:WD40 repeat protein